MEKNIDIDLDLDLDLDLDNIFDYVSTGHRYSGYNHTNVENYFKYFIIVAQKYKIYNYQIQILIEHVQKINFKLVDKAFFILKMYTVYENELKKLILTNTNKLNKFI